jgi:hypothetical protein
MHLLLVADVPGAILAGRERTRQKGYTPFAVEQVA